MDLVESEYKDGKFHLYNINEIGKNAISKGRFIELYDDKLCHQTMNNIENNMHNMYPKWSGEYKDQTYNLKNEINKVIIVIAIITIIIAIIISNKILKPIEVVSNTANTIGEGGYDCKLDYKNNIVELDNFIKSIVDLHKGNIDVKSKVNEGSEFIITLPII